LSKLNLNLQSEIIQKYLNKDLRRDSNELFSMLEDVNEILKILMMIVEQMYNLNIERTS
jgi:argininosuccinate lyase